MNTTTQLSHRLAMIKDDLDAIRQFIHENNLNDLFQKTHTKYCEEAWTHLNNIEVACDLSTDESLSWKKFGSGKLAPVYYDDIFISTQHDEPYEIYHGCNFVLVDIDQAEDYANEKIESGEWQAFLIPDLTSRKIIYHNGDTLPPPPTEIVYVI